MYITPTENIMSPAVQINSTPVDIENAPFPKYPKRHPEIPNIQMRFKIAFLPTRSDTKETKKVISAAIKNI